MRAAVAVALLALATTVSATAKGDLTRLCDDSCQSVNGVCEDGGIVGAGAATHYVLNGPQCAWGTDCTDCGARCTFRSKGGETRESMRSKSRKRMAGDAQGGVVTQ